MVGHSPSPLMSPSVPSVPPFAMALPGVDGMVDAISAISPANRFIPTSPSPTFFAAGASAAAAAAVDANEVSEAIGPMDFSAEASSTATDEITESLNPASRHRLRFWRKIVAPGEPEISRNKHGAVVHEDRMFVFGGYCQENKSFLDEILMYDFVREEWTVLPNVCETDEGEDGNSGNATGSANAVVSGTPTTNTTSFSTATGGSGSSAQKGIRCRRAHSMTVFKDGLFVFGGFDGHTCLNDLWRLDLRSYKWRLLEVGGELPCQRGGHSAVLRGDQLIIHGGWDVGNVYFNDTHYIDLSPSLKGLPCQSVKALPVGEYVPQGRVGHSCVLVSDTQMLMFGGYGGQQYWDDLNLFDMSTQEWCRLEASSDVQPSQRTFSTMERCGHRVLLVGGSDHTKEMNDVMIFDLQRNEWQAVECMGDIPEGRFAHSTVVYKHKVYLYGGITQNSPTTGLYELTLESFSVEDSLRNLVKMFMVGSGIDYTKYQQCLPTHLWNDLNAYQGQVTQMLEWEAAMAAKADIEVEEVLPMEEDAEEEVEDSGDLDVDAELPDVESVLNATTPALIQTLPLLSNTPTSSVPVQQPPPYLYSVGQPAMPAPLTSVQTPLSGPSTFVNWGEPSLHTPDAVNLVPAFAHAAYHHLPSHPSTPGTSSAAPSTPMLVRCGMSFAGVAPPFGRLDSEMDGFGYSASVDVLMEEAEEENSDEEWELKDNEDDDWGARDAEVPFFPAPGTPSTASRRSLYSPARSMPGTPYTGGTPSFRRTFSSLPTSPASPALPAQLSFPSPYPPAFYPNASANWTAFNSHSMSAYSAYPLTPTHPIVSGSQSATIMPVAFAGWGEAPLVTNVNIVNAVSSVPPILPAPMNIADYGLTPEAIAAVMESVPFVTEE